MDESIEAFLKQAARIMMPRPDKVQVESLVGRQRYWQIKYDPGHTDSQSLYNIHYLRLFEEGSRPIAEWQTTTGHAGSYRVTYRVWELHVNGGIVAWRLTREELVGPFMEWSGTAREIEVAFPHAKFAAVSGSEAHEFLSERSAKMEELWG